MTTITAKFRGNTEDLKMVLTCGIRFNSTKKLGQNNLVVTWICEESNYEKALQDCMDSVSMREVELWNCNLVNIA